MGLSAPLNVHWELTNICNLKCWHCYQQDDGPRRRMPSSDQLITIAEKIVEAGVFEVTLTGGEVLLVPQLADLVRRFNRAGIRPHITSNGMLVDDSTARLLATLDLTFQVSIDAADPAHHNEIRRSPRAFAAAIAGVERLLAAGVEVSFAYTAMPNNLDELSSVVVLAARLGVAKVCVGEVLPEFGPAATRKNLTLHADAFGSFTAGVMALRDTYAGRVDVAAALLSGHLHDPLMRQSPCTALDRDLAVLHDGWAAPCPFVRDPAMRIGNVLKDDIATIWSSPAAQRFRAGKTGSHTKPCVASSQERGPVPLVLSAPRRHSTKGDQ